jgi:hypothetical protein
MNWHTITARVKGTLACLVRPHLDLYVDIGFAVIRTAVMVERYESMCREYIALEWRFLGFHGRFRLYSPYRMLRSNAS